MPNEDRVNNRRCSGIGYRREKSENARAAARRRRSIDKRQFSRQKKKKTNLIVAAFAYDLISSTALIHNQKRKRNWVTNRATAGNSFFSSSYRCSKIFAHTCARLYEKEEAAHLLRRKKRCGRMQNDKKLAELERADATRAAKLSSCGVARASLEYSRGQFVIHEHTSRERRNERGRKVGRTADEWRAASGVRLVADRENTRAPSLTRLKLRRRRSRLLAQAAKWARKRIVAVKRRLKRR